MSNYKVEMCSGAVINMPRDKARSRVEYISDYGLQAVIQRVTRTRAYMAAQKDDDGIRAIITPSGDRVTQF